MQPHSGDDFTLTPRIETHKDDVWFTNLYDQKADAQYKDDGTQISFDVKTSLQDEDRNAVPGETADYDLTYQFGTDKVTISAVGTGAASSESSARLVVPILSPTGEEVRQVSENRIEIDKPDGTVVVQCNVPLTIRTAPRAASSTWCQGRRLFRLSQNCQVKQRLRFRVKFQ